MYMQVLRVIPMLLILMQTQTQCGVPQKCSPQESPRCQPSWAPLTRGLLGAGGVAAWGWSTTPTRRGSRQSSTVTSPSAGQGATLQPRPSPDSASQWGLPPATGATSSVTRWPWPHSPLSSHCHSADAGLLARVQTGGVDWTPWTGPLVQHHAT